MADISTVTIISVVWPYFSAIVHLDDGSREVRYYRATEVTAAELAEANIVEPASTKAN